MSRQRRFDPVKTMKVLGEQVEFFCNSDGQFSVSAFGEHHSGPLLKDLIPKVQRAARKQRIIVDLPATVMDTAIYKDLQSQFGRVQKQFVKTGCRDVVMIGYDPKKFGEVQCRYVDTGELVGVSRFERGGTLAKRMGPEDVAEFERLHKAKEEAEEAYAKFERKWELKDALDLVKKAIAAKVDTPQEPEPPPDDPRLT